MIQIKSVAREIPFWIRSIDRQLTDFLKSSNVELVPPKKNVSINKRWKTPQYFIFRTRQANRYPSLSSIRRSNTMQVEKEESKIAIKSKDLRRRPILPRTEKKRGRGKGRERKHTELPGVLSGGAAVN